MNLGARFLIYFLCFTQFSLAWACVAIVIGSALEIAGAFLTEFFHLA